MRRKKAEQLKEDKKFNDSQTTKGFGLMALFIVVVVIIGLVEALSYGVPTVACLLLYCPPIFVALSLLGEQSQRKKIGCWSMIAMTLFPGSWIPVLMEEHTPETVDNRLPRAQYVEPELDRKMLAYVEAVNRYNWAHNLPLISPESNRWNETKS